RRARALLGCDQQADPRRGPARAGLARRGGCVLGHAAARQPARRVRLDAERSDAQPSLAARTVEGAAATGEGAGGAEAGRLERLPSRARRGRVLGAGPVPASSARALRAEPPRLAEEVAAAMNLDVITAKLYGERGYPHEAWTWMRTNDPVHWCTPPEYR